MYHKNHHVKRSLDLLVFENLKLVVSSSYSRFRDCKVNLNGQWLITADPQINTRAWHNKGMTVYMWKAYGYFGDGQPHLADQECPTGTGEQQRHSSIANGHSEEVRQAG